MTRWDGGGGGGVGVGEKTQEMVQNEPVKEGKASLPLAD